MMAQIYLLAKLQILPSSHLYLDRKIIFWAELTRCQNQASGSSRDFDHKECFASLKTITFCHPKPGHLWNVRMHPSLHSWEKGNPFTLISHATTHESTPLGMFPRNAYLKLEPPGLNSAKRGCEALSKLKTYKFKFIFITILKYIDIK